MTLLPLTTLVRVKRRLGLASPETADTNMDASVNALISAVSQAIEKHLGLPAGAMYGEQRTEVHAGEAWQHEVALRGVSFGMTPTVASLKTRTSWLTPWDEVDALTAETDYTVSAETPWRILLAAAPPVGRETVQAVYTAGFVAEFGSGEDISDATDDLIEAFPDIADAADAQVVWEYERRKTPGQSTVIVENGSMRQGEVRLLASVVDRLRPYGRVWL